MVLGPFGYRAAYYLGNFQRLVQDINSICSYAQQTSILIFFRFCLLKAQKTKFNALKEEFNLIIRHELVIE